MYLFTQLLQTNKPLPRPDVQRVATHCTHRPKHSEQRRFAWNEKPLTKFPCSKRKLQQKLTEWKAHENVHAPHNGGLDAPLFSPPPCFFLLFSPCQVVQADRRRGRGGSSRRPSPQAARSLSACAERHRPMLGHPCGRGGQTGPAGRDGNRARCEQKNNNKQTNNQGRNKNVAFSCNPASGFLSGTFHKVTTRSGNICKSCKNRCALARVLPGTGTRTPPPPKKKFVRACVWARAPPKVATALPFLQTSTYLANRAPLHPPPPPKKKTSTYPEKKSDLHILKEEKRKITMWKRIQKRGLECTPFQLSDILEAPFKHFRKHEFNDKKPHLICTHQNLLRKRPLKRLRKKNVADDMNFTDRSDICHAVLSGVEHTHTHIKSQGPKGRSWTGSEAAILDTFQGLLS